MSTRIGVALADVMDACYEVAHAIHSSGWRPDVIVAVARGGLTPAHWLAHLLPVQRVTAIDVGFADKQRTRMHCGAHPEFHEPHPARLLVVEDAVDTGRLLAFAASLVDADGRQVRTAALYRTARSPARVDFVAATVDEVPRMPWEAGHGG